MQSNSLIKHSIEQEQVDQTIFNKKEILDAMNHSDIDYIKDKLDKGLDPDTELDEGCTLLLKAIATTKSQSFSEKSIEMVELLLINNANPNQPLGKSASLFPIIFAVQYENVKVINLLLKHGADINHNDKAALALCAMLQHKATLSKKLADELAIYLDLENERSQDWIISVIKSIYPKMNGKSTSSKGYCNGLALTSIFYTADDLNSIAQEIREKGNANCPEQLSERTREFIKKTVIVQLPKLSPEICKDKNLQVKKKNHTVLYNQAFLKEITPDDLKNKGGIVQITSFSGAYSKDAMKEYFQSLIKELKKEKHIFPYLNFVITANSHAFAIKMQVSQETCDIIVTNSNHSVYLAQHIAEKILPAHVRMCAFVENEGDPCITRTDIYIDAPHAVEVKQIINNWRNTNEMQRIHQTCLQKARLKDTNSYQWSYFASECGEVELTKHLLMLEKIKEKNHKPPHRRIKAILNNIALINPAAALAIFGIKFTILKPIYTHHENKFNQWLLDSAMVTKNRLSLFDDKSSKNFQTSTTRSTSAASSSLNSTPKIR